MSRFAEGRALRRGPGGRLPARRLWETGAPEDQIDSSIRSFRLRRRGPRRSQARSAGGAAAGCAGSRLAPPHQRAPLPRLLREKIRASHALRRCSAPLTTSASAHRAEHLARRQGGPGARAAVVVAAPRAEGRAVTHSPPSCAPGEGKGRRRELGHGRAEEALKRSRSREPGRWPRDGADSAALRSEVTMGVL